MYICICNQIDEKMLEENPALKDVCGSQCGSCLIELEEYRYRTFEERSKCLKKSCCKGNDRLSGPPRDDLLEGKGNPKGQ